MFNESKPDFCNPDMAYHAEFYSEELPNEETILSWIEEISSEWSIKIGFSFSNRTGTMVCSATKQGRTKDDPICIASFHSDRAYTAVLKAYIFLQVLGGREDYHIGLDNLLRANVRIGKEVVALKRSARGQTAP